MQVLSYIDGLYKRTIKAEDFTEDIDMGVYGLKTLTDIQSFNDMLLSTTGHDLRSYHRKTSMRMKHIPYFTRGIKHTSYGKTFQQDHKLWDYDDDKCTVCHGVRVPFVVEIPYFRLVSSRICCDQNMIAHTHWTQNKAKSDLVGISYHCKVCKSEVFQ